MTQTGSMLWYFEDADLYNILCPHKAGNMEDKHLPLEFTKDEFIYFPNEPSMNIYMIAEGRVKIGGYSEDGKEIVKKQLNFFYFKTSINIAEAYSYCYFHYLNQICNNLKYNAPS